MEPALQLLFLAPEIQLRLQLAPILRTLLCGFVDRDGVRETPGAVVEVREPHRRRQKIRIAGEGALEARLRHVILSEHERGDARAEAKACVAGLHFRRPGESRERIAEPPGFNRS